MLKYPASMLKEQGEFRPDQTEVHSYTVGELSGLVGLRRSTIDYLTRLGLTSPQLVGKGTRTIKNFGQDDVTIFQKARELLETGHKPRKVVTMLSPEVNSEKTPRVIPTLTHMEEEVLRRRYMSVPRASLETIGEDFGVSRQTIHAIERNGVRKLVRRLFSEK